MRFILNIFQAFLLLIVNLIVIPFAIITGAIFGRKYLQFVAKYIWSPPLLFIVGARVKVKGNEKINPKPHIYVANHSSHFDIPVLFMHVKTSLHFIAKQELRKIPLFGLICTMGGMIWIDRKNKSRSMETMMDAGKEITEKDKNVIAFPEGSRSKDGNINIFKKGSFVLSQATGIDITPIYIHNTRPLNPPGKFSFKSARVTVVIGDLIKASDFKDKSAVEYANYVQGVVISMKEDLLNGQQTR